MPAGMMLPSQAPPSAATAAAAGPAAPPAPAAGGAAGAGDELNSDDDELNSADDESDDGLGDGGSGGRGGTNGGTEDGDNTMLCQFEKVRRVREQWKVTLKGGVATINGKSFAFSHCDAEFAY